jgi:hypothetical protein
LIQISPNKIFILIAFCFLGKRTLSQDSAFLNKQHEIGIDITNTLTFLKKNYQSYLLNYRYYYHECKYALRVGVNFDISNGNSEGIYPDMKFGIQRNKFDQHWNTYFGLDASYSYYKSNATPVSTTRIGLTPFGGVQRYLKSRVSFSSEIGINFHQFFVRSRNAFDPSTNTNYGRINIAYVGMFMASYHF